MNVNTRKTTTFSTYVNMWRVLSPFHSVFSFDGLDVHLWAAGPRVSTWDVKVNGVSEWSSHTPISLEAAQLFIWDKYFLRYQDGTTSDTAAPVTALPPAEIPPIPQLPSAVLAGLNSPLVVPAQEPIPAEPAPASATSSTEEKIEPSLSQDQLLNRIEQHEKAIDKLQLTLDTLAKTVNTLAGKGTVKKKIDASPVVDNKKFIVLMYKGKNRFILPIPGKRKQAGGSTPVYGGKWSSYEEAEAFWNLAKNYPFNKTLVEDRGWEHKVVPFDEKQHGQLAKSPPKKFAKKVASTHSSTG